MPQHIFTGSASPSSAPSSVGSHYIDTVNKQSFISVGTSSPSDWIGEGTPNFSIVQVTSNYTATSSDDVILGNGNVTITMPDVAIAKQKVYTIKNVDGSTVTVTGHFGQNIDGINNYNLNDQYEAISIIPFNGNWLII